MKTAATGNGWNCSRLATKRDGVVVIDDTFTHKTGEKTPHIGNFYDHSARGYIWGQDLIYVIYADNKTTYPLCFRFYEKHSKTRVQLAKELVDECIEIGVLLLG